MVRYAPFIAVWVFSLMFILWLVVAPRVADPRFFLVEAVDIKLGSTQTFNAYDPDADKTASHLSDAAKKPADPEHQAPPPVEDPGLMAAAAPSPDGIRINALNPDLQEEGTHGPIPRVALDGRAPWQYYARPFLAEDTRPRLAIIVKDMGLSEAGTKDAVKFLPGGVTLAFSPYAENLAAAMQVARDDGHETLLQLPLEVPSGSRQDVGGLALSTQQTAAVNQDNLLRMMAMSLGSVGFITEGGGRLVNNDSMLKPMMSNIAGRGLVFVDDTQQTETLSPLIAEQLQSPWARSVIQLDATLSQDAIDVAMGRAIALAQSNGRALVVAGASPLARNAIANWVNKLERAGVSLAPLSAVTTLGSAGQASLPTPPAAMAAPDEAALPELPEEPAAAPEGPINLLNQTPQQNLLQPAAPPLPAPLLPTPPSPAPASPTQAPSSH